MKRISCALKALSLVCALNFTGAYSYAASPTDAANLIKVRILKLSSSFPVSGVGLRFSGSPNAAQQTLSVLPVKKSAVISYLNGTWTISNNEKTITVLGSKLEISGDALTISKQKVPASGLFVVTKRKSGVAVDYVARLNIEDYLVDVVASELPFHWPLEAQKAQAVAARSYAMSIMRERRNQKFHVDSSTQDQVYQYGRSAVRGATLLAKIKEAVEGTRDVTLLDAKGRVLKSYFHAHCGGQTEEPREVWGVGPKFGVVNDSGCALSKTWKAQIPFSEIIHRLARTKNGPAPISIENIDIRYKLGSQRVDQVLITALESQVKMKAQDFREMFGYDRVKSTLFQAKVDNGTLYLEGRGHGHGVGMCQSGARVMALGGANYEQILNKYYPLAQISKPAGPIATHEVEPTVIQTSLNENLSSPQTRTE